MTLVYDFWDQIISDNAYVSALTTYLFYLHKRQHLLGLIEIRPFTNSIFNPQFDLSFEFVLPTTGVFIIPTCGLRRIGFINRIAGCESVGAFIPIYRRGNNIRRPKAKLVYCWDRLEYRLLKYSYRNFN